MDIGAYEAGDCSLPRFQRGDANGSGEIDLSDPIALLFHLYLGGAPLACRDAADMDDDGSLGLTDAIGILSYLFLGGPPPAPPFPACGPDPTPGDGLDCADPRC